MLQSLKHTPRFQWPARFCDSTPERAAKMTAHFPQEVTIIEWALAQLPALTEALREGPLPFSSCCFAYDCITYHFYLGWLLPCFIPLPQLLSTSTSPHSSWEWVKLNMGTDAACWGVGPNPALCPSHYLLVGKWDHEALLSDLASTNLPNCHRNALHCGLTRLHYIQHWGKSLW